MNFLSSGVYRICSKNRRLALTLAALLFLVRLSRLYAQDDNTAGYRHEYYKEDDDRMKVQTDTFDFDAPISPKVRMTGSLVFDSISGATPTGAPPPAQWPYPTFNQIYQQDYQKAFASEWTTQSNAYYQNYVVTGYDPTGAQLTNTILSSVQQNAGHTATNNATTAYQKIVSNPNYKSTSVPLTQMEDFRVAFNLGVPILLARQELTPGIAFSAESDYVSRGISLNDSYYFNDKNTTLNTGWSGNFDIVRDANFIWEHKTTLDYFVGVTQLLSPKSYVTANLTLATEAGYLSDPYRGVMAANFLQFDPSDGALIPENRPRHRTSGVIFLGYNRFFDSLNGAAEVSYRYFHDDWHINAQTIDLQWLQNALGKRLVLSPMFRYYYQTAASFYDVIVPNINDLPNHYSADYRLSEFNSFSVGLKATYRIHRYLSLDAGYMRYVMRGLDAVTSQSAYPAANVFTLGLRGWW